MASILPLTQTVSPDQLETVSILKKLGSASRQLAELKGLAASIPRPEILINTLVMQEAKDSSAIENIVTTHDELYRDDVLPEAGTNAAAKEVLRYRQALKIGFDLVRQTGLLSCNHMIAVQRDLEQNDAGFRKVPGTTLKDGRGRVIYEPPQSHREIVELMSDLEKVINDPEMLTVDPLIKMAVIHHRFETIHPFYDGNGRTGRIINVLFLVHAGLLDIPILYLSRHIVTHKADYYRLLQQVRDKDSWEEWILYMLTAVEQTAIQTSQTVNAIKGALQDYTHRIRDKHRFYSQDLINSLFNHPYTRITFIERDLQVSRLTATRYLDQLTEDGFLEKQKIGRNSYYINVALNRILTGEGMTGGSE